jgi:hypothetical protein
MFGPSFAQFNMGSRRGGSMPAPIVSLAAGLRLTQQTIQVAQLNTLHTTPVIVVPPSGSLTLLVPFVMYLRTKKIAGGAGTNRNIIWRYTGTTITLNGSTLTALFGNGGGAAAVDQWMASGYANSPAFPAATDLRGRAVEVFNVSGANFGTLPAGSFLTCVTAWGALATPA